MIVQKTLIGGAIEGKKEKDKLQLKKEKDNFVEKITFALTKPHIVYPSPWAETIPEKLKREVPLHRVAQLIKGEEEKATDLECLIYLYPATMEFPLSETWSRIYFFLFAQVMGKEKADLVREGSESICSYTLSKYEMEELDRLKEWIWKKQWKHYKEKKREEKKAEIITEKCKQAKLNFEEYH